VNVDLVVLRGGVRDRKGGFASDLREQDFEIHENGARQSIQLFRHEDVPVIVGLVVDHSGSMRPKLADVIAAARTFARSSNPEDQMLPGEYRYRVVSTKVAGPYDVAVLDPSANEVLTLVTCYPFYFAGSAPERFIVRAERVGHTR